MIDTAKERADYAEAKVGAIEVALTEEGAMEYLDEIDRLRAESQHYREALEVAVDFSTELVNELLDHDCSNPDGGNTLTCEKCAAERTINRLHNALKGGE